MLNAFLNKLSGQGPLPAEDVTTLQALCGNSRAVPAQHDLIREGDKAGPIYVLLEGWACRYKLLPEGTRQITAILIPGDCCDLYTSAQHRMEHSVSTLTPARVASVQRRHIEDLIYTRQAITRAFWWTQLVDEDTLRTWIVSMGRRSSVQRVAHLMCELYVRSYHVGLASEDRFEMPLTQIILADALGLTPVHVNRVLRKLRVSGVMELSKGTLIIKSVCKLAQVAGFDDAYLHNRLQPRHKLQSVASDKINLEI